MWSKERLCHPTANLQGHVCDLQYLFGRLVSARHVSQVAFEWSVALGPDEGGVMLRRLGLSEAAVDAAVEAGAWQHAFALAQTSARAKLPALQLQWAMHLEDEGRFGEAEAAFLEAGKPREAIDM